MICKIKSIFHKSTNSPLVYLCHYYTTFEYKEQLKKRFKTLYVKIKCDSEGKYCILDDIPEDEMKKLAEVLIGKLDIMSETEFREISFDKSIED